MAIDVSIAHATGTLTLSGNAANTETVTIGGKVYTFQTSLTDVDGNVKVGADAAASIANLAAAIQLGSGAGTVYAASMTRNPAVDVFSYNATTLVVRAPGGIGNLVDTTETLGNGSWGGTTLASGSGNLIYFIERLLALNQINAEVMLELKKLTVDAD